jgi:hypothetical protein
MPRSKHLKIIIGVDGTCAINAINFTGRSCLSATKEIANALATSIRQESMKPEARLRERTGQAEREGAR